MNVDDVELSDEELAAEALAADPDAVVDRDAVPLWGGPGGAAGAGDADGQLLPSWYMPAPAIGVRPLHGWGRWVAIVIIAAFLAIDAYGLCSTYGWVGFG